MTPNADRGSVLVVSLWLVMALALIAAAAIALGTSEQKLSRNAQQRLKMDAVLEAGLYLTIHSLVERTKPTWSTDGSPREIDIEGYRLQISVQDEAGKVDLNFAAEERLKAVLTSHGVAEREAEALTDAIADWRDRDDQRRAHGAEKDDYHALGLRTQPRNALFTSISELRHVRGMSADLYNRLAPVLTVYSQRAEVDRRVAPAGVLRMLPGMDAATVSSLLRERATDQRTSAETEDLTGRAFLITVEHFERERVQRVQAVVRLTGDIAKPYWIMAFQPFN